MNTNRRHAVAALIAAGLLWGTTVPLSKLALDWLSPGWLTAARFGLAAAVLLAAILLTAGRTSGRAKLRAAFTPKVLAWGVLGYGGSVMVQNAGISRTSVTHAALLIGATPVLVAIIAAVWHRTVARPVAWVGFVVSLLGVGLVTAGGGGGGATMAGDGLVLASLLLGAAATVAQGRLLTGRDPVAVTAVQFLGAAVGALLVTVFMEGAPAVPGSPGPVLAVLALTVGGTVLPFTLFAFGQSRVSAEVAGAFLNLEPLVGAIVGAAAFGDPVGLAQVAGGAAIVAGIGLSSLPLLAGRRRACSAARRGLAAGCLAGRRRWSARGWQHMKVALCPIEALDATFMEFPDAPREAKWGICGGLRGEVWCAGGRAVRDRDRGRGALGRGRAGTRGGRGSARARRRARARARESGTGPGAPGRRARGDRGRSWPGASTGRSAAGR